MMMSDEMIDNIYRLFGQHSWPTREELKQVLIVPLEWEGPSYDTNYCYVASTMFGTYSVVNEDGWYAMLDPYIDGFEWNGDRITGTKEEAFAAAQRDYNERFAK